MTRSLPEANSAISRIREMPYGIAHSTAAVAELDRITLERARRGDMAAHAAIYERYGTACYNLALRVLSA